MVILSVFCVYIILCSVYYLCMVYTFDVCNNNLTQDRIKVQLTIKTDPSRHGHSIALVTKTFNLFVMHVNNFLIYIYNG